MSSAFVSFFSRRICLILGLWLAIFQGRPVQAQSAMEIEKACSRQFSNCSGKPLADSQNILKVVCEKRKAELQCERLKEKAPAVEKEKFLSCDNPQDICNVIVKQTSSLLYQCGAGVGGVLVDSVLGLILLPKTAWEVAQNLKNVPESYKSCSSDFKAKLLILGDLRPKDMTDVSIQRMSCGEVRKFVETKVAVVLERLETRRQQLATNTGNDKVTIYDLKLSESELQALNDDRDHAGPLKRASCFKAEEAAQTACQLMAQGAMTVTGAGGTAKLVRVFKAERAAKPLMLAKVERLPEPAVAAERSVKILSTKSPEQMAYGERKVTYHTEKTETALKELGVSYRKLPKTYTDRKGRVVEVMNHHQWSTPVWDQLPNGGGELYHVRSVKRGTKTLGKDPALQHSDMPEFLKMLEKDGYGLVVDSTLTFPEERTTGVRMNEPPMILISPETSWASLQHEYQHVLFEKHIAKDFKSLEMKIQSGENLQSLLSENAQKSFSKKQIQEMENLMKAGVSTLSVNERMATMKELDTLGWRRITTTGIEPEVYGLQFTHDYLTKLSQEQSLTSVQRETLKSVESRLSTLKQRYQVMSKIESNPQLAAGGAAVSVAGVFGAAMYLNKDGAVVFKDPNTGKWVLLKGK